MTKEELEIKRIEAEIAKIEAERLKLLSETDELKKRLNQKWYSDSHLYKFIIGGIVTAGLLAAWIIGYFQPILLKKQELTKLEIDMLKIQRDENERERALLEKKNDLIQRESESLILENKKLLAAQKELEEKSNQLQSELKKFSDRQVFLAEKQNWTGEEKLYSENLSTEINTSRETLKLEVEDLRLSQQATKSRLEQIKAILNEKLKGVTIVIHYTFDRNEEVNKIKKLLSEAGMDVRLKLQPNKSYAKYNGHLYYNSEWGAESLEVVRLVKGLIAKIEPIEVTPAAVYWLLQSHYDLNLWIVS